MKTLNNTDYVVYDKLSNNVVRFASDKKIVIYSDYNEASDDCHKYQNVIPCTELPTELKNELINQLNF